MSEHPETEAIAAYLNDGLPAPDRATLEAHLAECRPCRQEVTSARRMVDAHSVRNRRHMMWPAAAAAILALALLGRELVSPRVQETVRGGEEATDVDVGPSIQVLSPVDGDTISRAAIHFTWAGQTGRLLYRFTLTDGSGQAVWMRETNDTALTLPATVTLAQGRSYFWYVDALDSAGRSLTTGTRTFSTHP